MPAVRSSSAEIRAVEQALVFVEGAMSSATRDCVANTEPFCLRGLDADFLLCMGILDFCLSLIALGVTNPISWEISCDDNDLVEFDRGSFAKLAQLVGVVETGQ